jgi:DNA-binding NarL/FixJ family response regulator
MMMMTEQRTNGSPPIRVLLADAHTKVRSALRLVLEHQPGIQILGEAVDATGVADWLRAACPDVILLDWELPGGDPAHLVSELRTRCPSLAIIALSSHPEAAQAALHAGAHAFVSKGDPPEQLLTTLHHLG